MRHKLRLQALDSKLEAGRKERDARLRRYTEFRRVLGRTMGHMAAAELDQWVDEQFRLLEGGRRSPREITDASYSAWVHARRSMN